MNYFFLGKDKTFLEFANKFDLSNYKLLNYHSEGVLLDCHNVFYEEVNEELNLDIDFIFEYHIKRYGKQAVIDNLFPEAKSLWVCFNKILNKGDIIFSCNSGDYISRLLHSLSREIGFEFYYLEQSMIKDTYMISPVPYIDSKFGKSELELEFLTASDYLQDVYFWDNYFKSKKTKYNQLIHPSFLSDIEIEKSEGKYDGLFVGQLRYDTSIVLIDKTYNNPEEMAREISLKNPNKTFCYKPHPKTFESDQIEDIKKLNDIPNLDIVYEPVADLFEKCEEIYCISSTVGLEASLIGKRVNWYGDIWYAKIDFSDVKIRNKFLNACKSKMLPYSEFH